MLLNVTSVAIGAAGAGVAFALYRRYACKVGSSLPTSGWTLTYFPVPGPPGETQRILLALGGCEWTDERVPGTKWPAVKPTTKYGQMPALKNVDGKSMAQSQAMARYLAKGITVDGSKLYPDDAWLAFQVDEFVDSIDEVRTKNMNPTFAIKDQKEKETARAVLFATDGTGMFFEGLKRVEAQIDSDSGFIVGKHLSLADVWVFATIQAMRSGFIDGIPRDGWLDKLPKLKASVAKVAAQPAVQTYLKKHAESTSFPGPIYKSFGTP